MGIIEEVFEERINAIQKIAQVVEEDLLDEQLVQLAANIKLLDDERAYQMEELNELCCSMSPIEIIEQVSRDFWIDDDYFKFGVYGIESLSKKEYASRLREIAIDVARIIYDYQTGHKFPKEIQEILSERH